MRVWATAARRPKARSRGAPVHVPALGAPAPSPGALKNFVRRKRAGARSPGQRLSPKWHRAWEASTSTSTSTSMLKPTRPPRRDHTALVCHERVRSTQRCVAPSNQPPAHDGLAQEPTTQWQALVEDADERYYVLKLPCVHVCFDGGKPKTSCATWFCSGRQAVEARKRMIMIDDAWRTEKPSPNS